jgi:tetratricopeptide (TPR) repeat protein
LGRYDKAKEAWTRWGEVVEPLANEFPGESIYRAELAGSYYNVGTLLAAEGDRTAAAQHYQSASLIWDKLTQDFPQAPMYRRCVACAHNALGGLLGQGGEWRAAAEHHRQAVDLMRRVVEERPKALKYCWELAKNQNELATALKEQGEWAAAKKQYQDAIEILIQVVADCPDVHQNPQELKYNKAPAKHEMQSDLASCHFNLAELLTEDGDPESAESHYGKALDLQKQLMKDCPAIPQYGQGLAVSLINLGSRRHEEGQWVKAEEHYGQALDLLSKLVKEYPGLPEFQLDLARGHRSQAALLLDLNRPEDADKALDQALALCQKLTTRWPDVPAYSEELATVWLQLGDLRAALGRNPEAKTAWRNFLKLAPDTRHSWERKAWFLATCPDTEFLDPAQAVRLAQKAVDKAPRSRRALQSLGVASYRAGDWKPAADALNESLRFSKSGDAASDFFLAMTHWQRGDKEKAHRLYERTVEAMAKNQPNQHALRRFRAEAADLLGVNGPKSKGNEASSKKN